MTLTLEAPVASAVYQQIPLAQIAPSPHQARKDFDPAALQGLADSMKAEGLLEPVLVRQVGDSFELISGERRFRAAKLLGWTTIEAKVIQTVSEAEAAAKGMVENLQRADLNPIEEAQGFQALNQLDPDYWDQPKIAKISGRSQEYISLSLKLLGLAPEVAESIRRRILSRSHGLEIMRLPLDQQAETAKKAVDLSQKETRKLVDGMLHPVTPAGHKPGSTPVPVSDPLADLWSSLQKEAACPGEWKAAFTAPGTWHLTVTLTGSDPAPAMNLWFKTMSEAIAPKDPKAAEAQDWVKQAAALAGLTPETM